MNETKAELKRLKAIESNDCKEVVEIEEKFNRKIEDNWEQKAKKLEEEVKALKTTNLEQQQTISKCKMKVLKAKKNLIQSEQKLAELQQIQLVTESASSTKTEKTREDQVELLKQEVESLTQALKESVEECKKLCEEKKKSFRGLITEEISKKVIFKEYKVGDYFVPDDQSEKSLVTPRNTRAPEITFSFEESELGKSTMYSKELEQAMMDGKLPAETQLYLLKQQLVDAAIYNHSLHCLLSSFEWKLYIEQNKSKMMADYCEKLEKSNDELDKMLKQTHSSHNTLRKRLEKFEEAFNKLNDESTMNVNPPLSINPQSRLVKTFNRRSFFECKNDNLLPEPRQKSKFAPQAEKEEPIQTNNQESDQEKLNDKIAFLQKEFNLQVSRAEQLEKSYMSAKENINRLKGVAQETEQSFKKALKEENDSWQAINATLKVYN